MKYLIFAIGILVGIPIMAYFASLSKRNTTALMALAIFAISLGTSGNINFLSMEMYRGPDRGFELSIFDLITMALFLKILIKNFRQIKWLPYNFFPLACLFIIAAISLYFSDGKIYAAFSLFKFARIYFVYFVFYNLFTIESFREPAWLGIVGIGVYFTFTGLKQKYLMGIYRIHGTFDHSNTIPLFLNMMIPVLFIWNFADRELTRFKSILTFLAAFGMLFCVVATFSRAGTVFAGFSVFCVMFAGLLKWRSTRTYITVAIVLSLSLMGAVKVADSFIDRINNAPKSSKEAREEFNAAADAMMRDHFFGVGLNNFSLALTDKDEYKQFMVVMSNEEQAGVCHHIYRLMGAEMGKIGLFFFLLIMTRFTWICLYGFFSGKDLGAAVCFGIFSGFISLHLSGFFEWAFRLTPVMAAFAVMAALGSSLALRKPIIEIPAEDSCQGATA